MLTRRHPNQGFTLLELLAVLAIASVLSGIGIVGWQGSQRRLAVDATVNQIISIYQAGRFQAIRRGAPVAVFQEGNQIVSFALDDDAILNCNNVNRNEPVGSFLNWQETLPPGHVVVWNATEGVIWQPTGLVRSCTGALPSASIRVTANGADVARLTINGAAGRIARANI